MKFCRELDAGRAGTDDGDLQLLRAQRLGLCVRANAGIDQPAMEALGLRRCLQRYGVFLCARRAEIVGQAAHRDDERVVGEPALRCHRIAVLVDERRDVDHALRSVQAHHLADAVTEIVPVGLRQIVRLIHGDVHAAGRDRVQMGFPEMRPRALDERDVRLVALTEPVAQTRGEFETTGPAANDHDSVQRTEAWRSTGDIRSRCNRVVCASDESVPGTISSSLWVRAEFHAVPAARACRSA